MQKSSVRFLHSYLFFGPLSSLWEPAVFYCLKFQSFMIMQKKMMEKAAMKAAPKSDKKPAKTAAKIVAKIKKK